MDTSIIINGQVNVHGNFQEPLGAYYEVLKVVEGVPVYLEDHIHRLNHSLTLAGIRFRVDLNRVLADIDCLFKHDGIKTTNIRYAVYSDNGSYTTALRYVNSDYPTAQMYHEGVDVKVFAFERQDPEIKQLNDKAMAVRQALSQDTVYEYLLVDTHGLILEGTRTNVFFVKGKCVYTAETSLVLGGITRHHVAELIPEDMCFIERALSLEEIHEVDAAFLTGTSIGVLPIKTIDNKSVHSAQNAHVKRLRDLYEANLTAYLKSKT